MHRHSTDLVGLIFGTAFALAGVGFLIREATDSSLDPAWAAGLGLILLGVVALAGTVARGPRRDAAARNDDEPGGSPETGTDELSTITSDG